MPTLINRNLTEHRGSPRIYLDDKFLDGLEFNPEKPFYDRVWHGDKLVCVPSDSGTYTISSKKKAGGYVNVIDINTKELTKLFNVGDLLRISIRKGALIVQAHASLGDVVEREERFISALRNNEKITVGSLCHGGGIMDAAMHEGFNKSKLSSVVSYAVEIDSRYLQSSMKNNKHIFDSNTVYINSDIAHVHTHGMRKVHVLLAGLPCQGASLSGISKNKIQFAEQHETAGACFFSMLNIVMGSQPAVVVLENVKAYIKTASFAVIKSVLGSLGYDLLVNVYNGLDFAASESRERMVCIAVSKGLNAGGMLDDIENMIESLKVPSTPLADVLDDLDLDHPAWKEVSYLKEKQIRDKAANKGFAMQILTRDDKSCGCIGSGYAKARSTEPRLQHPTNPNLSRLFNKNEHARIKKAPVSIVAGLSETVGHQILGNGVVFSLFVAIAQSIGMVAREQLGKIVNPRVESAA